MEPGTQIDGIKEEGQIDGGECQEMCILSTTGRNATPLSRGVGAPPSVGALHVAVAGGEAGMVAVRSL